MKLNDLSISQTAMSTFRDCPYAWYCYKNKKDPMFFNQEVLDIGSYVHDTIDVYYSNHRLLEGTKDMILHKVYGILKDKWDLTLPPEGLKKAYTCLNHFSIWEHQNIMKGITRNPFTEIGIGAEGFYGIIDYFDHMNEIAIDWKTNKYATLSYGYKMQAAIYRLLIKSQFNVELKYFNFFFLYPNEWRKVNYDTPKMKEVMKDVNQLHEAMKKCHENDEYPKQPRISSQCKNCLYRFYCKVIGD